MQETTTTAFSLQNPSTLGSHALRIALRSSDFLISSQDTKGDTGTCHAVLTRPFRDRSGVNIQRPRLWTYREGDWDATKVLDSSRGSPLLAEVQEALHAMADDPSEAAGEVLRDRFIRGEATQEDWKAYGETVRASIAQAMGSENISDVAEGKVDNAGIFHLAIPSALADNDLSVQIVANDQAGYVKYVSSLGGEVGEYDIGLRPLLTKRGGDLEGEWDVSLAVVGVRKDGSAITELSSVDRKGLESELQAGLEMLRDHPTVVSALGELNGQGKTGVEAGHEVPWINALTKLQGAVEKVFC